jgi:putative hydrolase of the HAD superfamily
LHGSQRLKHILLDLDNTVYPASSPLEAEIGRRMTEYVSRYLDVSIEKALEVRRKYLNRYGTTLSGLIHERGFQEVEDYLRACHPEDVEAFLQKDPALKETLNSISLPLSILTNSPMEHARRVLDFLDVSGLFQHVFDIRYNGFQAKPSQAVFRRVLNTLSAEPRETLFVDDMVRHLVSFRDMGGNVLLVDEAGTQSCDGIPAIQKLMELPTFLSFVPG